MYEEHESIYEIFCKHQGFLANQGFKWCNAGYDCSKCDTCSHREPIRQVVKVSSASI